MGSKTQIKKLPLHRRPWFAKRVLEIGGGHAPYAGVTHAVDKFPNDDAQRAGAMVVASQVVFKEGELESIPFESEPKFDFVYASHVLEHVESPVKAAAELSRVARAGYLETPSPLREQIACPVPFDEKNDFHTYFCWVNGKQPNTVHVVKKSAATVGQFCDCADGKLARCLFQSRRTGGRDIEPLLPRAAKTTRLHFKGPLQVKEHASFSGACRSGSCAYRSATSVRFFASPLICWWSGRFRQLSRVAELV